MHVCIYTQWTYAGELKTFQSQCYFATTPSGWMTTRIFTIWSLLFSQEITKRQQQLISIYWPADEHMPCFLFVTQPFDVQILFKGAKPEQSKFVTIEIKFTLPNCSKKAYTNTQCA